MQIKKLYPKWGCNKFSSITNAFRCWAKLNILKIKVLELVHNLEGVGRNLQDHLETYVQQECKTSDTLYSYVNKLNMMRIGIQWFLSRTGPCSTSFLEAGGFCQIFS